MATLVLGAGIVGKAVVWDLRRRGHDVTVADSDRDAVSSMVSAYGAVGANIDVSDVKELTALLSIHDIVVSAVPYRFGYAVASAAIATGTHYMDFGGNPAVVAAQLRMHQDAVEQGVLVVPDCGLAPGLANVLAEDLIQAAGAEPIESVQMRVGALPLDPVGALGYQLAFNPAGLINEYAEPCEVIIDGQYATVEPLARFEDVEWDRYGPLEAFSTAGGTSTMSHDHEDQVQQLEYKTLRYPGHGAIFRAMFEVGLFDETPHTVDGTEIAPRAVLLNALDRALPRGGRDLVLVRVWSDRSGTRSTIQIEDTDQSGFSALARTTAFPASALADLISRGVVTTSGVLTMHQAVSGAHLMPELAQVGIEATHSTEDL